MPTPPKTDWRAGWHRTVRAVEDQLRKERSEGSQRWVRVGSGPYSRVERVVALDDDEIREYAAAEATRRAERSINIWNERHGRTC